MTATRRSRFVLSVAALFADPELAVESKDLVAIPQSAQQVLVARDEKVTLKASAFFLAEWDAKHQSDMTAAGVPFKVILKNVTDDQTLYLFELHDGEDPPAAWKTIYRQGRNVIVVMTDAEADGWSLQGEHSVRLWHEPRGWGRPVSDLIAYDCTNKPLIAGLLGKTTQTQWMDWIEKLSGTEPVVIAGTNYTITSRFTATMFSGAVQAKGFEFVKQQAQAWGYSGANYEEDPFTTGPQGKNLIVTIPGQTTDEVIISAHLDSIFQSGDSTTSSPGANDNGTGTATVLEAMRLLRQYRFQRTIRMILFTGEEQGLFGSAAYANDHSLTSVLGVLNLDMFGWDSNGDRCFEIHAGTLPASIDIANCFTVVTGSYSLGLTKDFLTTTATDRSDHASFWNHGTGAIEIAENFFNDGQVCVGADANPFYHTNNDRIVSNMTPTYGFLIAQAGLATISSMAIPINTCFASAPAMTATGAPNRVDLSWGALAGAAKYRVYRSAGGCGGNFVSIGETASAAYLDPIATPGTYAYKIEAVTVDSCYSLESNCATASPITSASVTYQAGSAVVLSDSGDHDLNPDNCETVTVQVGLVNDGNLPLTGVHLSAVTSSHPAVTIVEFEQDDLGPLALGQSTTATFKFRLGQNGNSAACNQAIPFTVTTVSDQSAPAVRALSLTAEAVGVSGNLTFGFENDLSGWTVATGAFTVAAGGAPGSATGSLHSRSANNVCDAILSPVMTPAAPSTMTMWVNFSIEGNAGAPSRWDRAIVRVVNTLNGVKSQIAPTGVAYNTTGSDPALNVCDSIGSLQGWSGDRLVWSQASFNLSSFAGIPIQIEVRFATDNSTLGTQGTAQGFWFDQVEVVNASSIACDGQTNACAFPAEVSPAGAIVAFLISKSGPNDDLRFAESAGASSYNIYSGSLGALQAGTYDHDAFGRICGVTDALPGDGMVNTLATLQDNTYSLVVGTNGMGESVYGVATAGPIPATLEPCP